jgi:hypothetical protein
VLERILAEQVRDFLKGATQRQRDDALATRAEQPLHLAQQSQALVAAERGVQRERVRVQAFFELQAVVARRAVLDAHVAHDLSFVARQLERGQRRIDADDVGAVAMLVDLEVGIAGPTAQVDDPSRFSDQQHLLSQLPEQREVARHDERLQDGGVGGAQLFGLKHGLTEVSDPARKS